MMPTPGETAPGESTAGESGSVAHDDRCDPRIARSRARILAAATEILVEAGPRAVTVDAVAERSGVAKSTLYRHWDSRVALMIDVMRSNIPAVTPPDPSLGFEASLRTLVGGAAATLATPEWARIMPALISLQHHVPDMAELVACDREAKAAVVGSILELGAAEGLLPRDLDPNRVVQLLMGPLVFVTISGQNDDLAELADHVVDRFLASYRHRDPDPIAPDGRPSPPRG